MSHLTTDEIIDFVSSSELNDETLALSARVNGHIRKCEKCIKLVNSFQLLHDEFTKMSKIKDFRNYYCSTVENENSAKPLKTDETVAECKSFQKEL